MFGRRHRRRQTDARAWVYLKLTCEPDSSGELNISPTYESNLGLLLYPGNKPAPKDCAGVLRLMRSNIDMREPCHERKGFLDLRPDTTHTRIYVYETLCFQQM